MRILLAIALALAPLCASAQTAYPPGASSADLSAVQAQIPPVCTTVPAADTLLGTNGTASACTPKQDNTRPTAVQAGNTTLAANCAFAVTLLRSFTSATPFVYAAVVDNTGTQMPCKVQARSSTAFSGICNPAQTTLLNATLVAGGLSVAPFASACTAGTPVTWVAREPTQ